MSVHLLNFKIRRGVTTFIFFICKVSAKVFIRLNKFTVGLEQKSDTQNYASEKNKTSRRIGSNQMYLL